MRPKSDKEIQSMREGGKMLATVLQFLTPKAQPGVTTAELDVMAAAELKRLGGKPAFLGYQGFPAVICISVNDAIVHGIPTDYELKNGDVLGLDFGVEYNGLITDSAITIVVGENSDSEVAKLISGTKQSLAAGIAKVKDGAMVGDISHAIEERLRADSLGVIESLVGHGTGNKLHEPPEIPNFGQAGQGPVIRTGMTIAVEPMATLGGKDVYIDTDKWTVKTADGALSAHFEHTVLVTETGAEILTLV